MGDAKGTAGVESSASEVKAKQSQPAPAAAAAHPSPAKDRSQVEAGAEGSAMGALAPPGV